MKSLLRRAFGLAPVISVGDDEDPIRSELFSVERLEQHAHSLAAHQPIASTATSGRSLVARLRDNERTTPAPRPSSRSDLRLSPKQQEYVQLMNAQVLGEVLIRLGSITREHLAHALTVQRAANIHIGEALVETGAATWDQVKRGLEVQRQLRRSAA